MVNGNSGGGGEESQMPKMLREGMKGNWKFQRGMGGSEPKIILGGGMAILWYCKS